MAYIPSETLNSILSSASFGIWLERLADGRTAIVFKIPETVIKAIYRGARTTLLMASIRTESLEVLCLALWVDDERERPFKVTMVNSSEDDKALLIQVLESHAVTVHCVNELNHPALSAWCFLDPSAADTAAAALRTSMHWILTPAFSNTEQFICVVQAKALAVLSANPDQSSSRRVSNVEKDIKKGLKQLAGAIGNIRSPSPISSSEDGAPIMLLNRGNAPAHAILVLSEMYFGVDWKAVAGLVAEASESDVHRALFHVVDIQELATLSAQCQDSATFSNRLVQRWAAVQEKGTAYMRAKLPV